MVSNTGFIFALENLVERTFDTVEVEALKIITEETYEAIFLSWPAFTFYSMANHRISITGTPIARVEPSERPTEEGALLDKQEATRRSELAKLKRIKPGKKRKILIGNAVSYAPDVGFKSGNGLRIYEAAAQEGSFRAQPRLDQIKVR